MKPKAKREPKITRDAIRDCAYIACSQCVGGQHSDIAGCDKRNCPCYRWRIGGPRR